MRIGAVTAKMISKNTPAETVLDETVRSRGPVLQRLEEVMIKKIKGKYVVLSEKTGRSFGSYRTLADAKRRLGQVEFFKRRPRGK
jgi:hypothetical protein